MPWTADLTLCYSAAEYACPVSERSSHAKKVDPWLSDSFRSITGCLKPTYVDSLHVLAGIAPPGLRRSVASGTERLGQTKDIRHPCHAYQPAPSRLQSRRSFLRSVEPLTVSREVARLALWDKRCIDSHHQEKLPLPTKAQLPSGHRQDWRT